MFLYGLMLPLGVGRLSNQVRRFWLSQCVGFQLLLSHVGVIIRVASDCFSICSCRPLKCVQWAVLLGWRSVECLAGHHNSCLSSIGQTDVKMFVVRAGWCPQLTNEQCEVLFIHQCSCVYQYKKLNPAYMQTINTYVYI